MNKRGNPQNLTPWKKGVSGNRTGRPKELLTQDGIKSLISKFYRLSPKQLMAITEDEESELIEIHVASIIMAGIRKGDLSAMNGLLDRTIGRVPDPKDEDEDPKSKLFTLNYSLED